MKLTFQYSLFAWTILFLSLLSTTQLFSQAKRYKFEQLSSTISLPNHTINTILQDHKGFLWIGTWSGLFRYDGYNLVSYQQSNRDEHQLKSNKITSIFEDSKGNLWIGSRNSGFYKYDYANDHFTQYKHEPNNPKSLSNDNVWCVFEDKQGYIWVGTEKGLNRFDANEKSFRAFVNDSENKNSLSNCFVYSICQSEDDLLWVGTENGLNQLKYNPSIDDYTVQYFSLSEGNASIDFELPKLDDYIYHIIYDKFQSNTLWVGTKAGIKQIKYQGTAGLLNVKHLNNKPLQNNSLSNNFVMDIIQTSDNKLWIATMNGLNLLNPTSLQFQRFEDGDLNNNSVKSLYLDRTSILWIGTENGVNKLNLNKKPFYTLKLDQSKQGKNNMFAAITKSEQEDIIWAGIRGKGLSKIELNTSDYNNYNISSFDFSNAQIAELTKVISDIIVTKENELWIGTQGAGIIKQAEADILNNNSKNFTQILKGDTESDLADDYVMSLLETQRGNIWSGYWNGGLDVYDKINDRFITFSESSDKKIDLTKSPNVTLIEAKVEGIPYLWVGSRGNGMMQFYYDEVNNTLTLVNHFHQDADLKNQISNNFINSIFEDSMGNIWIGTENGANLLDLKTKNIQSFLKKDGLADRIIQDIRQDSKGRIWMSTQEGLSCLRLKDNEIEITNYDSGNGLEGKFFNTNASCMLENGHLVFGSTDGISIIDPINITLDTIAPQVAFTNLKLFNKTVPINQDKSGDYSLSQHISETKIFGF